MPTAERNLVLVSDDSIVARKQVCKTLQEDMALDTVTAKDGKQALGLLQQWADDEDPQLGRLAMIMSDIEMPEMDGYTFTTEARADPRLEHLYIILHPSLSGISNQSMVDRVGANKFIAKFDPDILAEAVIAVVQEIS